MKANNLFNLGVRYKVGNGQDTSFWGDVWVNDCPLKIAYSNLFNSCHSSVISVSEGLQAGSWDNLFRRNCGVREKNQWENFKNDVEQVELEDSMDKPIWCLEKSGIFSVKSLYNHLLFGGVNSGKMSKLWKSKCPLKVRIFIWFCYHNRVQSLDQLKLRGWKGNPNCLLCGAEEDINHNLFR